jgi:voltage-gated potassium channel|nr:potassium channel family protein [Streptococcus salivarius]
MTYTHLTTNELVTIEAYYQENIIKINIKYIFRHFLYAIIFINTITKENQMKRLNTLFHIIKVTGFNQFLISFVSFIFISGGILLLVEPQISNYWDGLWYAFVTSTTVGYGDILATTLIGRITSVFLTVYGLIFFGCLSAVIVNYYSKLNTPNNKTD